MSAKNNKSPCGDEEVYEFRNRLPEIEGLPFKNTFEITKSDYDHLWEWANQMAENNYETGDLNITVDCLYKTDPDLFNRLIWEDVHLGAIICHLRTLLEEAYADKTEDIRSQQQWARQSLAYTLEILLRKPLRDLPDRQILIDQLFSQPGVLTGLSPGGISPQDCLKELDRYLEIKRRSQEMSDLESQLNVRGHGE
jgi:hypothetical protein